MRKMFIASSEQMRELDRTAIEEFVIPGIVLMENAGRGTVRCFLEAAEFSSENNILIVCGKGNNGGDGFVVARHLWNAGFTVSVLLLSRLDQLRGDAQINAEIAARLSIPIHEFSKDSDFSSLDVFFSRADVIFDAIFGTGLSKPAGGMYAEIIRNINSSGAYVVSIDIPSGLFADSPTIPGPAVQADMTVTFGLPKLSLLAYPSARLAGQVITADISIPWEAIDRADLPGSLVSPSDFSACLEKLPREAHKGTSGHLLVIAGAPGKTGAAALAGNAALRSGTGLVTIAIPEKLNSILEIKLTEVMTAPVKAQSGQFFSMESLDEVIGLCEKKSAVLLGPGIGTSPETRAFVSAFLEQVDLPIVIDADGLNCLSQIARPWKIKSKTVVLTPHPGEMARLMNQSVQSILADPLSIRTVAAQHNAMIAFKTARTLIFFPDGRWLLNFTGNPGLASGGTGDVLSGIIAGFLARSIPVVDSVSGGVFLHGLAGDITAAQIGEQEMIAGDIPERLGIARILAENRPDIFSGEHVPYTDFLNSEEFFDEYFF